MSHARIERRVDVDWLRVFATYLLFVFHAGMVFSPAPFYHVRNAELSMVMLVVTGFISLWHMPLFFVLAGWSIVASLRARGGSGFAHERLLRLGVPLLVGCVFLMPPIKYLELASGLDLNYHGLSVSSELQAGFKQVIPNGLPEMAPFHETFRQFLPTFYTRLDRFTWAHLWFVAYLLTFTMLYRPLIARLLASRDWTCPAVAWVYAPVPALVLVQVLLRPYWPGIQNLYDDWANVAYYSIFLLAGAVLARHPAIEALVTAERRRALAFAALTMVGLLLGVLGVVPSPSLMLAGSAIAAWCSLMAILGYARTWRLPDGPVLAYLAESSLPVYVLHQLAIVAIGYWLVQLPFGIAAKFTLLVLLAFAATMTVYHVVVRPLPPLRFAFGMRPRVCPLPTVPARAAATIVGALMLGGPGTAWGATAVGRWYAEGGAAQVEVRACGRALCGAVVWLRSPFDEHGCLLRDRWNPDPSLRGRGVIGLDIIHGLVPVDGRSDAWGGGTIYDPGSGRTYRVTLELDGDDRALLRGYLGIPLLGRTTTWVRVGSEERVCRSEEGRS